MLEKLKSRRQRKFDALCSPKSVCYCAPSPPPAPDYTGAATAQGAANKETAIAQSLLNNPNVYSAYGSQRWYDSGDGGRPTLVQELTPEGQNIFNKTQYAKGLMADASMQGAGALTNLIGTPVDYAGIGNKPNADIGKGVQPLSSPYWNLNAPGLSSTDFASGAPELRSSNLTAGLPGFSSTAFGQGAPNMPGSYDSTRKSVIDAMMSRANEDYARQSDESNSNLIAAGIRPGTKAYADRQQMIERSRNDARQQAEIAGGNAAQQAAQVDMARRQQGVAEQQAQFGATAAQRGQMTNEQKAMFDAAQAARQQRVGEAAQQFGATAQQRGIFGNEAQAQSNLLLQQRAQQLAQNQAQFGTEAEARRQSIAELLAARQMPLNEISALMSGSQVVNPFAQVGVAQNTQIQPPPIYNAAQQAGQYGTDVYNTQVGQQNALMSGLFNLGAAGIRYSDRRLKSNIVRIGDHPLGIGIYEYEIHGSHDIGVMADEVMTVRPEAVVMMQNGYMAVDYGRL